MASPSSSPPASAPDLAPPPRRVGLPLLCLFALGVGLVTGLGAAGLRALIGLVHNLFFVGTLSFAYDPNVLEPPNPWGPFIILAPVIGGLVVVFLVRRWAPEARGHGVPEVLDAIYYRGGRIRAAVVLVKSLAAALSIGSGASVGREGPIIQIGSGIGSAIGQAVRLPSWQVITLVAAGGGAGIAATFNTPLGGLMFAIELMLPEVSARTFLPVVIATGAATYVGWVFFGFDPAFAFPLAETAPLPFPASIVGLPVYVGLGVLCGGAAALFIRSLYWMEDRFEAMPGNAYTRNLAGMTGVGILLYALYETLGQHHVGGVGSATVQEILRGGMTGFWVLLLLFVAKLLATTVSLAAGASGGVFSPSLFLGATLGGALGALASALWPEAGVGPAALAVIGMAAFAGAAAGTAMTAILMIFEMTRDYGAIVPTIIAVALAVGVRRVLSEENIYTLKLVRRGRHVPKERHSHMFMIRHARDVATPLQGVTDEAGLARAGGGGQAGYVLLTEGRRVVGLVPTGPDGRPDRGRLTRDFLVVRGDDFLREVMQRMGRRQRDLALVVDSHGLPRPDNVVGVLTRQSIADRIIDEFAR